jgi:hypothetical protein
MHLVVRFIDVAVKPVIRDKAGVVDAPTQPMQVVHARLQRFLDAFELPALQGFAVHSRRYTAGESLHIVTNGKTDFFYFIPALLQMAAPAVAEELYCSCA